MVSGLAVYLLGMPDTAPVPEDKILGLVDEALPLGFCASEAVAVHRCLDERNVPRVEEGQILSLWGRVLRLPHKFLVHDLGPDS